MQEEKSSKEQLLQCLAEHKGTVCWSCLLSMSFAEINRRGKFSHLCMDYILSQCSVTIPGGTTASAAIIEMQPENYILLKSVHSHNTVAGAESKDIT